MLRRISVIASLVLAVALSATIALAADEGKRERPEGRDRARRGGGRAPVRVELTEEQKAKLKEINEQFKAAIEKAETRAEKTKLMQERRAALAKVLGRDKMGDRRGGPGGSALDLTDEQKAKLKEINEAFKAAMAKAGDDREAKMAAMKKRRADTEAALGAELMKKLRERRGGARRDPFAGLKLTEKQQGELKTIKETFMKAFRAAKTREEKGAAVKARKEAIEKVLTKEQLAQFRKNMQGGAQRGPGGRRPGGARPGGARPGGTRPGPRRGGRARPE